MTRIKIGNITSAYTIIGNVAFIHFITVKQQ